MTTKFSGNEENIGWEVRVSLGLKLQSLVNKGLHDQDNVLFLQTLAHWKIMCRHGHYLLSLKLSQFLRNSNSHYYSDTLRLVAFPRTTDLSLKLKQK
jgi:hypothetical protein